MYLYTYIDTLYIPINLYHGSSLDGSRWQNTPRAFCVNTHARVERYHIVYFHLCLYLVESSREECIQHLIIVVVVVICI